MNKKKLLFLLAAILVLAVPFSVYAATSNTPVAKSVRGFFGIDTSKLTDQQKSDIQDYSTKMANLQKEFINKMVSNGTITKDQGDAEIKKIDEMLKNGNANGFAFGFGKGIMREKGNFANAPIDTSKLTSSQITDLTDTFKKMAANQKDRISLMVADGLITQAQADSANKSIDNMMTKMVTNGLFIGKGGLINFGFFGKFGADTSTLTDKQKSDLTDNSKKAADLQKELINKMVTYNIITKDQGNAASKRIDAMQNSNAENSFDRGFGNFGMRKGMMRGRFGNPQMNGTSNSSSSQSGPTT